LFGQKLTIGAKLMPSNQKITDLKNQIKPPSAEIPTGALYHTAVAIGYVLK